MIRRLGMNCMVEYKEGRVKKGGIRSIQSTYVINIT